MELVLRVIRPLHTGDDSTAQTGAGTDGSLKLVGWWRQWDARRQEPEPGPGVRGAGMPY